MPRSVDVSPLPAGATDTSDGLLLVAQHGRTLVPDHPSCRVVLTSDDRIVWVGDDPAQAPTVPGRIQRIDLDGAELFPAFVDAHVHMTATGLSLGGLDLRDAESVAECLAAVSTIAEVTLGRVIWGGGWDEFSYPEGRPPNADELAVAASGRPVLLSRADGHSAVIDRVSLDTAPLARIDGVERDGMGRPTGLLRREANDVARRWFVAELPAEDLAAARALAARQAVTHGVGSVHEMGGPDLMGAEDFDEWMAGGWPCEVVGYWAAPDLDFVALRGLRQVGGALHLDGSIGSRTAALECDYTDGSGPGRLYEATEELVEFVARATERRIQVGLHCIGDRAVAQAVGVLEQVAELCGLDVVQAARHRLEHVALVPDGIPARLARLGVVASVQPGFDRRWGTRGGLYDVRLGAERAAGMNPLRELAAAGVALALGSDGSAAPLDPWAAIGAAAAHHNRAQRLSTDEAVTAAILGGRRAARQDDVGRLAVGQRADMAAFAVEKGQPTRCVLTVVRGRVVHQKG